MEISFDQFSQSVEVPDGIVSLTVAKDIVDQYIAGQQDSYESEDSPFAISMFAFRKNRKEFIEIAIDSKTDYRVRIECQRPRKLLFLSWLSSYSKDLHVPTVKNIQEIVEHFYQMSSEEFYSYFTSLPYKESKFAPIGVVAG
jgi:hypothetical protein